MAILRLILMIFGQPSVIFSSTFSEIELVVCSTGQRGAPDWYLLSLVERIHEKLIVVCFQDNIVLWQGSGRKGTEIWEVVV